MPKNLNALFYVRVKFTVPQRFCYLGKKCALDKNKWANSASVFRIAQVPHVVEIYV